MTGSEIALVINSIATLVGVVGGMVISLRNGRKIEQVHKATNSMKDQLVASEKQLSFNEGVTEGAKSQQTSSPAPNQNPTTL